jgi:predicted anti-sigma-YlaC factor YlaD
MHPVRCTQWLESALHEGKVELPAPDSQTLGFGCRKTTARGRSTQISGLLVLVFLTSSLSACSVRKFAVNKLGDSLANGGATYASDNDPEFIGQAVPFSLKLIEGLLAESPDHRGLLFAAASGYTQYSYVYIQLPAEETETSDVGKSAVMRDRARNLYLRARDFGLHGLDTKHPGFSASLHGNPIQAVRTAKVKDVPLLYWTAASWGAAISISKDHPELVADQLQVQALIDRAYQLNPDYNYGTIHQFLITYESARQGVKGDYAERCKLHFDRSVKLTDGQMAAPYVAYAESVSIQKQNRAEFESLLRQALAINPNARVEWRLSNTVMQRRAAWLLSREDDLFLEPATGGTSQ